MTVVAPFRLPSDPACLRVAVLIAHRPNHPGEVGGLAGTWERLAQTVRERSDIDLTVFFLGDRAQILPQATNVRYVLLPPLLGTECFPFLRSIPTHTDLAPLHPRLWHRLRGFHVIHTTDTFNAFASTAWWRTRYSNIPLVASIQTDTIGWARIHTPAILQRLLPSPSVQRWVLERYGYLDRQERKMERRFGRYIRHCRAVFISHARDRERVQRLAPHTPHPFLRRGLDLTTFHPCRRDRVALEKRFGIPPHATLLLFVGRLDPVKGVMIAADVVRQLVEQGNNVHFLIVGHGAQRQQVAASLGAHGTFTGNLPHHELATIYASADVLLFPSEAEVWPNVVMEARACGLPVIACTEGASHVMKGDGHDGLLLPDRQVATWLTAVTRLLAQPERLRAMRRQARQEVEATIPSWTQVFEEDVLPVWRQAAWTAATARP